MSTGTWTELAGHAVQTRPRPTADGLTISAAVKLSSGVRVDNHGQAAPPPRFEMTRVRLQGCREKTLKYIHCRPVLVAICTLVVIECACVLTELMVDLQGIKYRFESQEKEIGRFVDHIRSKYPDAFTQDYAIKSVRDLVNFLQHALPLWPPEDLANCRKLCPCKCADENSTSNSRETSGTVKRSTDENKSKMVAEFPDTPNALLTSEAAYKSKGRHARSGKAKGFVVRPSLAPQAIAVLKSQGQSAKDRNSLGLQDEVEEVTVSKLGGARFDSATQASRLESNSPLDKPYAFAISKLLQFLFLSSQTKDAKSPIMQSFLSPSLNTMMLPPLSALSSLLSWQPTKHYRRLNYMSPLDTWLSQTSTPFPSSTSSSLSSSLLSSSPLTPKSQPLSPSSPAQLSVSTKSLISSLSRPSPLSTVYSPLSLSSSLSPSLASNTQGNLSPLKHLPALSKSSIVNSQGTERTPLQRHSNASSFPKAEYILRNIVAVPFSDQLSEYPHSMLWRKGDDENRSLKGNIRKRSLRSVEKNEEAAVEILPQGDIMKIKTQQTKRALISDSGNSLSPRASLKFHTKNTPLQSSSSNSLVNHQTPTTKRAMSTEAKLRQENTLVGYATQIHAGRTLLSVLTSTAENSGDTPSVKTPNAFKTPNAPNSARAAGSGMTDKRVLFPSEQRLESSANFSKLPPTLPVLSSLDDVLLLQVGHDTGSVFLLAELVPELLLNGVNRTSDDAQTQHSIYKTSKALHFVSLSILSVMVLETAVKLFCTGCAFFKKKFEVFDAFIVVSSFALDFVFLDSRWYETGKDATTILVFLLPWRVVRIVNSFLMTMKHKHHLQIMNMKRARKKAELKSAKLQTLLTEIRKDVQLLVNLCRTHEIEEKDITACLYGKGRRKVTLSAMSTCTSLMLISTLGKDAIPEDDIYGKVFKEALNEGEATDQSVQEAQEAEEAAIDAAIQLDEQLEARRKSRKYRNRSAKVPQVKRSYTVPRRTASVEMPASDINENSSSGNIFYINDGFFTARGSSCRSDIMVLGPGSEFTTIDSTTATCTTVDLDSTDDDDIKDGSDDNNSAAGGGDGRGGSSSCHVIGRDISEVDTSIIVEDNSNMISGRRYPKPRGLAPGRPRSRRADRTLKRQSPHQCDLGHQAVTTMTSSKSDGGTSSTSSASGSGSGSARGDCGSIPSSSRSGSTNKGPAPAPPPVPPLSSPEREEVPLTSPPPPRPSAHPIPPARTKFPGRGLLRGDAPKRSNRSNSLVTFEVTTQVTYL